MLTWKSLWAILGKELTNSKTLQKMMKWKRLTNWFINKANRKKEIGTIMSEMIASKEAQTESLESLVLVQNNCTPLK